MYNCCTQKELWKTTANSGCPKEVKDFQTEEKDLDNEVAEALPSVL